MIKTNICSVCFAAFLVLVLSVVAMADTIWYDASGFEEPLFTQGNLAGYDMWSGQDGWLILGNDGNANLDGIVVQDSFVCEGAQAVEFDASVQNFYSGHLRTNVPFEVLPEETHANFVMDFYIADSGNRSEAWGLDIQNGPGTRLAKWQVWDDNSVTVLDPNGDWIDTGFEFERDTWYNIQTLINFGTMVVELYIDNVLIFTVDVINQYNNHSFTSLYLGVPGNDKMYFDNFVIQSDVATGIEIIDDQIPREISLSQNYPNPFNATTTIHYNLPEASDVTIDIYDINGRKVAGLFNGIQPAGSHQVIWDANDVSTGIYFYRLQADTFIETKKMVLLK